MIGLKPDKCVGIEQDQRCSLKFLLKRNPSALQCHCQTPLATAGSTISMIGLRRIFFGVDWRSGCTRNRTPRRSIITDSPRSAASRSRENFFLAVTVVKRFMADTIQLSDILAKADKMSGALFSPWSSSETLARLTRRRRSDRSPLREKRVF